MIGSKVTIGILALAVSFTLLIGISQVKTDKQNEIQTQWRELSKGLFKAGGNRLEANELLERLKKLQSFVEEKLDPEVFFLMDRLKNLIDASRINWNRCSANDFQQRKRDITTYLAASSNMVRYLLECERKQFDLCRGTLAIDLLDSLTKLSDQEQEKAALLAGSVFLQPDVLRRVGISRLDAVETSILINNMVPGLLEFISSQSGKLSANVLTGAEKAKKDFAIKWSNSVGSLCGKIMFEIEPTVRVFRNVFDDKLLVGLDNLTLSWIKTVDVCRTIQAIGSDKIMERAFKDSSKF